MGLTANLCASDEMGMGARLQVTPGVTERVGTSSVAAECSGRWAIVLLSFADSLIRPAQGPCTQRRHDEVLCVVTPETVPMQRASDCADLIRSPD